MVRKVDLWDGYSVDSEGNVYSPLRRLKPRVHTHGYLRVGVRGEDHYIHRLVWTGFHGGIPEGLQVRHLNGVKSDNRLVNLAVGTQSDNELDKRAYGADPRGENHGMVKLTEGDVLEIRKLWSLGMSATAISDKLNLPVSLGNIHAAATGRSWRHLPLSNRPKLVKGGELGFRKTVS